MAFPPIEHELQKYVGRLFRRHSRNFKRSLNISNKQIAFLFQSAKPCHQDYIKLTSWFQRGAPLPFRPLIHALCPQVLLLFLPHNLMFNNLNIFLNLFFFLPLHHHFTVNKPKKPFLLLLLSNRSLSWGLFWPRASQKYLQTMRIRWKLCWFEDWRAP